MNNFNRNVIGTGLMVIILLGTYLFFTSGYWKRKWAVYAGYSVQCIDGVKYVQFISGGTVKYKPDGTIDTCVE